MRHARHRRIAPRLHLPDLPGGWSDLLLPSPVGGRTIAPSASEETWADLGSRDGVRVGMRLFVLDVPLRDDARRLWGGRRAVAREYDVVEVTTGRCRLVDVPSRQAVGMLQPVPAGRVVTSRRPEGG